MPGCQGVRVLTRARDAVITPDALRLLFEEVNRLYIAWMEKGNQQVMHGGDVFAIEHQSIGRSAKYAHSVSRFSRQVICLLKVKLLAFCDLVRRKIFAALIGGWPRRGISIDDQRLPLLVSG